MHKLNSIIIFCFFSLTWLNPARSDEFPKLFAEGIKKYQQKDFSGAEKVWADITKKTPLDASVLLNQALSYSQQKKWGLALAYLREAQLIDPRNASVQQAYQFVLTNMKSRGFHEEDSFIGTFEFQFGKYFLLPEILSVHWLLSLILLLCLGRLFRERRRSVYKGQHAPQWQPLHWTLSAVWALISFVLVLKIASSVDQKATIISSGSAPIRSAPMAEAAELADIPEGTLISIRDFYQDWVQVRFADLPVGWLQRKDLLLLTPEGFIPFSVRK